MLTTTIKTPLAQSEYSKELIDLCNKHASSISNLQGQRSAIFGRGENQHARNVIEAFSQDSYFSRESGVRFIADVWDSGVSSVAPIIGPLNDLRNSLTVSELTGSERGFLMASGLLFLYVQTDSPGVSNSAKTLAKRGGAVLFFGSVAISAVENFLPDILNKVSQNNITRGSLSNMHEEAQSIWNSARYLQGIYDSLECDKVLGKK